MIRDPPCTVMYKQDDVHRISDRYEPHMGAHLEVWELLSEATSLAAIEGLVAKKVLGPHVPARDRGIRLMTRRQ